VKSGKPSAREVRDLGGVMRREGAAMGVFITLQDPTGPMKEETASAGFYDSPWGTTHPRLQILTVADLLSGKKIDMPPTPDLRTFKKATKAKKRDRPDYSLLPFESGDPETLEEIGSDKFINENIENYE